MQVRTSTIKIRVSEDELKALNNKKSCAQLAKWMREYCLNESKASGSSSHRIVSKHLVTAIARIGSNVNQIARALNTLNSRQVDVDITMMNCLHLALTNVKNELACVRKNQ